MTFVKRCQCCRVGVRVGKISAARASFEQEVVRQPAASDEPPQVYTSCLQALQTRASGPCVECW